MFYNYQKYILVKKKRTEKNQPRLCQFCLSIKTKNFKTKVVFTNFNTEKQTSG